MRESKGRCRGLQSFVDAGRGVRWVFRTEWNFRIHLVILCLIVVAGIVFKISAGEWLGVVLSSALVLLAEVINTSLEYLADSVHPEVDRGIGMAKDAAAGAVLIAAIAAAVVGAIIFFPKLWMCLTIG